MCPGMCAGMFVPASGRDKFEIKSKPRVIKSEAPLRFLSFCAIAERGADRLWIILVFTLFVDNSVCRSKITSKGADFVCRCRGCCAYQTGEEGSEEGKTKKSCSVFPWSLCIGSLMSLASHARDGKAFLRQVWDSRWDKRGLGRSEWSGPILTRRRNGARAMKGSSDLQSLFFLIPSAASDRLPARRGETFTRRRTCCLGVSVPPRPSCTEEQTTLQIIKCSILAHC